MLLDMGALDEKQILSTNISMIASFKQKGWNRKETRNI